MKKIIALMAVAAAVSAGFAQYRAVDRQAGMMAEGRPFLTDAARYNSYDLAGSPLGLFEIGPASRLNAAAGYRYYGLGDESGHYISGQTLRMGMPGRAFFEVFYGPDVLKNTSDSSNAVGLTLHRFGLTLASQATGGFFRSSIRADGYIGTQEWDKGDSGRVIMGFEALRLDMGSQVHPWVRIGFFFNLSARIDTLYTPDGNLREDRSAHMNLPEFGGNVDFGGEDVPVRSNLSFTYAMSRFVYTSKGLSSTIPPIVDAQGNANTILNDSLRLTWLTQGEIPVAEGYVVKPAFLFGISSNTGKMHMPHPENDPFQPRRHIDSLNYTLSGTYFGGGAGFRVGRYADLHAEYTAAVMSLNCGKGYRPQPAVKSRTLHHTSFGLSAPLHNYFDMPLSLTPRIAYFISGSAFATGAVHSDLDPLNAYPGKSKWPLYSPQVFLEGFERTSGFTFGIDGSALEDMLSTSFWMTFLSKDTVKKGGLELGLSVGFTM